MKIVQMYVGGHCPFCNMAKSLLHHKGVTEIAEIRIDIDADKRAEMMVRTGRRTVPQIFIGDVHVGGFDDLQALDRAGGLDKLLND